MHDSPTHVTKTCTLRGLMEIRLPLLMLGNHTGYSLETTDLGGVANPIYVGGGGGWKAWA